LPPSAIRDPDIHDSSVDVPLAPSMAMRSGSGPAERRDARLYSVCLPVGVGVGGGAVCAALLLDRSGCPRCRRVLATVAVAGHWRMGEADRRGPRPTSRGLGRDFFF
jgi:hypothetical protein